MKSEALWRANLKCTFHTNLVSAVLDATELRDTQAKKQQQDTLSVSRKSIFHS